MTRKSFAICAAVALALGIGAWGVSSLHAQPYGGWGMMGGYGPGYMHGYGPGYMHGYGRGMMGGYGYGSGYGPGGGYGPGMMGGYGPGPQGGYGPGYGPGMMGGYGPGYGPGWGANGSGQQGDLNLTTEQVKSNLERWITVQGNPRIKVGEVKEKDADTIEADIVTKDNSLVQRFIVNRHTGFFQPDKG